MILNLKKEVIDKNKFPNIIDVSFSELINPNNISEEEFTIEEFFIQYDKLFFNIPIEGEMNSHKELIKRSTEYVGGQQNSDEVDLLLQEIDQLRLELLESRQIINNLTQ